ncbi:hypothetical protein [Neobacillus drentensis]
MSTIRKFDLIIRDLGYLSYETLRSISAAEACNRQVLLVLTGL